VRSAAAALSLALPPFAARSEPGTRLILLGTGGGPRPKKARSAPAQAIVVGEDVYVVDCGDGVARQLVQADLALSRLRALFITHHHSDHNADFGNLLLLAWSELQTAVDLYGPPPLARMTELFLELNARDIEIRMADEARPPLASFARAHEIERGGEVTARPGVKVTAALVVHPPVEPSFGYRFDAPDRSIVISGDTARSEALIALAKGADVLVHEVLYVPGIEWLAKQMPNADPAKLREHMLQSHTPVSEAGRIAAEAGVKTLVLSHFVPGDGPGVTEEDWLAGARAHFRGEIVVGRDLMEI
jgi:ribonuclease BN (tRNA processing enzyme)